MNNKLYYNISEVSKITELKPHVIRFWELQFSQLKPIKLNQRRYFTYDKINLLNTIKNLLHEQKFTIEGAKKFLSSADITPKNIATSQHQNSHQAPVLQAIEKLEGLKKLILSIDF